MAKIGRIILPTTTASINGQSITFASSSQLEPILNKIALQLDTSVQTINGALQLTGFTVAGLPTGYAGMTAYVTDAVAPAYMQPVVGGGTVTCPVFHNGTEWVAN